MIHKLAVSHVIAAAALVAACHGSVLAAGQVQPPHAAPTASMIAVVGSASTHASIFGRVMADHASIIAMPTWPSAAFEPLAAVRSLVNVGQPVVNISDLSDMTAGFGGDSMSPAVSVLTGTTGAGFGRPASLDPGWAAAGGPSGGLRPSMPATLTPTAENPGYEPRVVPLPPAFAMGLASAGALLGWRRLRRRERD
jgi:hypothetical protein